jgi:hypothetical protein
MKLISLALTTAVYISVQTNLVLAQPTCDQIDLAISSTEDFAEVVGGKDKLATRKALGVIETSYSGVKRSLNQTVSAQITTLIGTIKSAEASGNPSGATVAALEIYRLLAGAFVARLPTTLNVAMLDYSGFRLRGLAAAQNVNWTAVAATVKDAGRNWSITRKKLKDKALLDLGDSIQAGLASASKVERRDWLNSTAQIQLDSVDLLERVIKNTGKGACN